MAETTLLRLQEGRLRLLEDEFEAWKLEADGQRPVWDAEDLIAEVLAITGEMSHTWERIWEILENAPSVDAEVIGEGLRHLFDRLAHSLERIRQWADDFKKATGNSLCRHAELETALQQVRGLQNSILSAWPWRDRPHLAPDK